MNEVGIIFNNRILDVTFVAWFVAQFYKVLETIFTNKDFNLKRFLETGGMPSSHSSTVSCLTTCIGIVYGTNTSYFAIAIVFAGITMYDAAGIRRAAGRQAKIVNKMVDEFAQRLGQRFNDGKKLKELLGHTPFEVLIGATVGIIIAFLFKDYLV